MHTAPDNAHGGPMPYVVKWVPNGQQNPREWPTAFPTPSEAIGLACSVLRQESEDKLWSPEDVVRVIDEWEAAQKIAA
jgi:hypothetical protein